MKRVYALMLSVVLAVMFVVPVIATGSVSPTTTTTTTTTTTATTTTATTTSSEPSIDEGSAAVIESTGYASVAVIGSNVSQLSSSNIQAVKDLTGSETTLAQLGVNSTAILATAFDLQYDGEIPASGVQMPIQVTNANVGDYAYVLHLNGSLGWEVVGAGFLGADLTIMSTFRSFSPVAVMVVESASVLTTSGLVTAPKTGEF